MSHYRHFPWLVFIGAIMVVSIVLGVDFGIHPTILIIGAVLGGMIFIAMAIWQYANRDADGDEWWQDDHSSGWRGY